MAGLTAARVLAEAGLAVTVLEARNRVGGRIYTLREHGRIVELGAEFVHGKPQELWDLIEEAGEETFEVGGSNFSYESGHLERRDEEEKATSLLKGLEGWAKEDISFAEYLAHADASEEEKRSAAGYVEGFNAADHRVIGVKSLAVQQAAAGEIKGDRIFRLRHGYDRLAEFLAAKVTEAGGKILPEHTVEHVEWAAGRVRVSPRFSGNLQIFEAARVVVALPLGVLQNGSIRFVPEPPQICEGRRLRMGPVCRVTLVFERAFWQERKPEGLSELGFLFAFDKAPRVWWTAYPDKSPTLTGWTGGPESMKLLQLSEEELTDLACHTLSEIFSMEAATLRTMLLGCYSHDWLSDPLSRGAYSYVPAGAIDASEKMTVPAEGTVFFAGEHTDTTGHWGTVHAAIRSAQRAAAQILERRF